MQIHWARAQDGAAAVAALSSGERIALQRLPDAARADWRAGRLAAKRAVAAALGIAGLDRIEIISRADQPPGAVLRTAAGRQPLQLALSLAHGDGRAIAAAARGARIGVDVERERALPGEQARYFLRESERPAVRLSAIVCWALKEAAWKALRLTRADPLTAIELVWLGTELVAVRHAGITIPVHPVLRRPWRGYVSALIVVPEAA